MIKTKALQKTEGLLKLHYQLVLFSVLKHDPAGLAHIGF